MKLEVVLNAKRKLGKNSFGRIVNASNLITVAVKVVAANIDQNQRDRKLVDEKLYLSFTNLTSRHCHDS
jgi:hypothetical protein